MKQLKENKSKKKWKKMKQQKPEGVKMELRQKEKKRRKWYPFCDFGSVWKNKLFKYLWHKLIKKKIYDINIYMISVYV